MPQIKKLADRKFLIRVSRGTGKNRVWDNKVFNGTQAEADAEARDMAVILGRGKLGSVRFEKCVEVWLRAVTPRLEPRTISGYESSIRLYASPVLRTEKLAKIEREDIQRVYLDCTKSPTTIRNLHAALNAFFSWCVRRGDLRVNPCRGTERPKPRHRTMVVLDADDAPRFIEKCGRMPNGLVFEFALETGMRPEEYLALRWSDIQGREIIVQRAVQFNVDSGGYYFKDIKTKTGSRRLPISERLRVRLMRHRTVQLEHRLSMKGTWVNEDLVFPNTIGRPHSITNITRRYFRPIMDACKFGKHITLYGLRHTCATLLLMNGTNPKIVSERLGHASIVMTLDTYSHVLPHIQDEATDAMDRILRKVI